MEGKHTGTESAIQPLRQVQHCLRVLFLLALVPQDLRPQQRLATFGPRIDLALDYRAVTVEVMPARQAQQPLIAVLHQRNRRLELYRKSGVQFSEAGTVMLPQGGTELSFHDGRRETMVLFSSAVSSVCFLKPGDVWTATSSTPIPSDIEKHMLVDINNDGKKDLLLFGRKSTGILVYLGTPDGGLREWDTLFPDISVSDVQATDLNGDRIVDLFLADWLSNRIVLFSGIGRGVFAEQIAADLPAGPFDLAVAPDPKKRNVRLAVTLPDLRQIRLYSINPLGEFYLEGILPCGSEPSGVQLSDLNQDEHHEVITGVRDGLMVFSPYQKTTRSEGVVFATGDGVSRWRLADVDGDGFQDAVVLCASGRKLCILGNAAGSTTWPAEYCVGSRPQALSIADFDHDSFADIAVANTASRSVSILRNLGDGRFDGQESFLLTGQPTSLKSVTGTSPLDATIVAAHAASGDVTVLQLNGTALRKTYTIPSGANPYIVFAEHDTPDRRLLFLVRNHVTKSGSVSLSMFQQISEDQFAETSLKPNIPSRVTALSLYKNPMESVYDLAFATFDRADKRSGIFLVRGTIGSAIDIPPGALYSFPDSLGSVQMAMPRFVDDDEHIDLIASVAEPATGVLIVYAAPTGIPAGVRHEWLRGARVLNEDALIVQDLDGDRVRDICFLDAVSRSVVVFYGVRGGEFQGKKTISAADEVSSIKAASLTNPKRFDLILANEKRGVVSILKDPFDE